MSESMNQSVPPAPTTSSTRVWLLVAVAFLAVFALLRWTKSSQPIGKPADFSWKVTDLAGRPVDLASFRGRPIFLNIWASWCPPCVAEMPSIERLASRPNLKDVAFLCVSVDEDAAQAAEFFASKKPSMTILHAREAPPRMFAGDGAIPATFIIAPDGTVKHSEVGSKDWDDAETVALLEGLLRQSP